MNILMVGMGIIGTIHGWALSQAGTKVTHLVRPGRSAKYQAGVAMDVLDLREGQPDNHQAVYHPRLTEAVSPSDGYDLVMVPTKAFQAAEAVAQLKDQLPETDFLLFTANWQGPGEIDALIGRSRYLWGYAVSSGGVAGDGLLVTVKPVLRIGELDGARTPRLAAICQAFGAAGLACDIRDDIMGWLWVHYAINAGMIGSALAAGGLQDLQGDAGQMEFMIRAVREALGVLQKRGFDATPYEESKPFLEMPLEEAAAMWRGFFEDEHGQRVLRAGHFQHSPEEMRRFFTEVYETGRELGVAMDHLDQIHQAIT